MTTLPTDRDASNTIAEHASDHNVLHALNNDLDDHLALPDPHPGYATDADVSAAVSALVDAAPATLDTLNELAAALGDDANYASTVTTALAGKSATGHGHAESDVTSLVSDLAGKAATGHTHSGTYVEPVLVDAKGDLLVGSAADTLARLAVGSNDQVLTADSSQSTGIKWAAASGGGIAATIVDAKGDLIAATAADTVARLAVGSNGQALIADSAETAGVKWASAESLRDRYFKPTGAYESLPAYIINSTQLLGNGTLYLVAIALPNGFTVSNITFESANATTTPTHYWFGLYNSSRVQLAVTADQLTTAWGANVQKTLAIATIASGASSTFTTTYEGLHYLGVMVTAGTPPTLSGTTFVTGTGIAGLAQWTGPTLCGSSNTSQTTPPAFPFTANALTRALGLYGFVS